MIQARNSRVVTPMEIEAGKKSGFDVVSMIKDQVLMGAMTHLIQEKKLEVQTETDPEGNVHVLTDMVIATPKEFTEMIETVRHIVSAQTSLQRQTLWTKFLLMIRDE